MPLQPLTSIPGGSIDPVDIEAKGVFGKDEHRPKLIAWLKKHQENPENEEGLVVTLSRESSTGDGLRGTVEIGLSEPVDEDGGPADELLGLAEDDALASLGKVKYLCKVKGREDKFFRFTLRVSANKDTDPDYYDSGDIESPEGRGLLAMAMRQANAFGKLAFDALQLNAAVSTDTIKQLQRQNEVLHTRVAIMQDGYEKAASNAFVRDLELRRFEREEERADRRDQMLSQFGPILAQVVAMKALGPAGAGAFAAISQQMRQQQQTPATPGAPPPPPGSAEAVASDATQDLQRIAQAFQGWDEATQAKVFNALHDDFKTMLG